MEQTPCCRPVGFWSIKHRGREGGKKSCLGLEGALGTYLKKWDCSPVSVRLGKFYVKQEGNRVSMKRSAQEVCVKLDDYIT